MTAAIAGCDVVTAYGWGLDPLWQGLCAGATAIGPVQAFAGRAFVSDQAAMVRDLAVRPGQSRVRAMLERLLTPLAGRLDPDTPLVLATTVGEIDYVESAVLEGDRPAAAQARPDRLLECVQRMLGLRGPGVVVSSACASSASAVAHAAALIRHGRADEVLVVAADAVTEFIYSGFSGLLSLSRRPARPFDAQRDGLSLGEGAAWALLTRNDTARPDVAVVEIGGWGQTSDAYHTTAPDPQGRGLARALRQACRMGGIEPDDIDFIAAHGTATSFSDAMEMVAVKAVFPGPRPMFSIKGGTGHTCGATGLIQILVAMRALELGTVPPTVGLAEPDPAAAGWVHDRCVAARPGGAAVSMNSGFGGVNCAVVLRGRSKT